MRWQGRGGAHSSSQCGVSSVPAPLCLQRHIRADIRRIYVKRIYSNCLQLFLAACGGCVEESCPSVHSVYVCICCILMDTRSLVTDSQIYLLLELWSLKTVNSVQNEQSELRGSCAVNSSCRLSPMLFLCAFIGCNYSPLTAPQLHPLLQAPCF